MYTSLIMPPSINICSFSSNIACQVLVVLQPLLYFVFSDNDEYQYTSTTISKQVKILTWVVWTRSAIIRPLTWMCQSSKSFVSLDFLKPPWKYYWLSFVICFHPFYLMFTYISSPIHSLLITENVLYTGLLLYEWLSSKP